MGETDSTYTYQPIRTTNRGRHRILCSETVLNESNISKVVAQALLVHEVNASDANILHRYYMGEQSILNREKLVRPEIDNRVVENRADEIVSFKVGYMVGDPVKYVSRPTGDTHSTLMTDEENQAHEVSTLNAIMADCDKHSCDRDVVQWAMECGVGYRLCLPTGKIEKPLLLRSLDPRHTFVVYSNDIRREPIFACTYVIDEVDALRKYTVYTNSECFYLDSDFRCTGKVAHVCGAVPIVEYPANSDRTGCFEKVMGLLDAINEVESDRVDGIEQFVQALMVFKNVDLGVTPDERAAVYDELRERGAIQIFDVEGKESSVELLTATLNQSDTQTLVDHLYQTVLRIVGMPSNIGGGASTSDTGVAVTLRDGWSLTETRAKDYELFFKRSESRFLEMACSILKRTCKISITPTDIEVNFTRRNYENTQGKAQVYVTLVQNGVPPTLAAEVSGIAPDPEAFGDMVAAWKSENAPNLGAEDMGDGSITGDGDATPTKKQTQEKE